MGLEAFHIVLIVLAVIAVVAIIFGLLRKRRQAVRNQDELRTVSTIQSVYYEPAKYTQHPVSQNTYMISSAPGWNLTNLDAPTNSVNIRQPSANEIVIIPREPMVHTQTGHPPYPVHETNSIQQAYGKPPPYNPAFQHSSSMSQSQF